LIATLHMMAAMVASGVITMLVARFSPFRVMAVGTIVWSLGVGLTGLSQGFCSLLVARLLTGAGAAHQPCVNEIRVRIRTQSL
jgi:hypothetical protein